MPKIPVEVVDVTDESDEAYQELHLLSVRRDPHHDAKNCYLCTGSNMLPLLRYVDGERVEPHDVFENTPRRRWWRRATG